MTFLRCLKREISCLRYANESETVGKPAEQSVSLNKQQDESHGEEIILGLLG